MPIAASLSRSSNGCRCMQWQAYGGNHTGPALWRSSKSDAVCVNVTRTLVCRQLDVSPVTHLMLAFELQGGWKDVQASVAATVLQFLLGGGGSFSSGGPGAGPACQPREVLLC